MATAGHPGPLCAPVFCTGQHWFGVQGPAPCFGSCNKEKDELSVPLRSCSPAGNMQHRQRASMEKGGRHLALKRRQDLPCL